MREETNMQGSGAGRLRKKLRRQTFLLGTVSGVLLFGLATGALVTTRPEVAYAAMSVIDSSNLAKNAETAAQTAKVLAVTKESKQLLDTMRRLIGMGSSFGGSSPFRVSSTGTVLGGVNAAKRAMPNVQRIFQGRGASLSDPASARNAVRENLSSIEGLKPDEERRRQLDRREAADEAQEQALGVALYMSDDLSRNGENRLRSLAEQAEAAARGVDDGGDFRLQIAALTTVSLALLDEMQQQRMLAAAMLQLQASRAMLEAPSTRPGNPGLSVRSNPSQGGSLFE